MAGMTWAAISDDSKAGNSTIYDWCWVCGKNLGPDKMHIIIDNGVVMRHTYCCRKHRYTEVEVPTKGPVSISQVQVRSDHEIESLAMAFRAGELEPGWE